MANPFKEGIERHQLLLQYDKRAGKYQFRPRPLSIYAGHNDLEWRKVSGLGQVYTFTVVPSPPIDDMPQDPSILAIIQLDEGVRIFAPLKNVKSDQVLIGMKVEICWPEDETGTAPFAFQAQEGSI